jgi:hypothetical protein
MMLLMMLLLVPKSSVIRVALAQLSIRLAVAAALQLKAKMVLKTPVVMAVKAWPLILSAPISFTVLAAAVVP